MCTRVCTTSRDRAGKMAVTRSVLVMMSPTTSTAAELGVSTIQYYKSIQEFLNEIQFLY